VLRFYRSTGRTQLARQSQWTPVPLRYPSGKGEVCKTFMRRFDSDPRLQLPPELASLPRSLAMLGISARGSDAAYSPQVRFRPAPPVFPVKSGSCR
jgi:hypothetical protein